MKFAPAILGALLLLAYGHPAYSAMCEKSDESIGACSFEAHEYGLAKRLPTGLLTPGMKFQTDTGETVWVRSMDQDMYIDVTKGKETIDRLHVISGGMNKLRLAQKKQLPLRLIIDKNHVSLTSNGTDIINGYNYELSRQAVAAKPARKAGRATATEAGTEPVASMTDEGEILPETAVAAPVLKDISDSL